MTELLYRSCYSLITILGIVQGVFVLYKNPRSRINVTWSLMSFSVATWGLIGHSFFDDNYERALFGLRAIQYVTIFIPVFFTHFCLALLNKPLTASRLALAGYAFGIGMAPFFLTPWFIPNASPKLAFSFYPNPGPLYVVFTIEFFVLVIYSHWLLATRLHLMPEERQNQIKYVMIATIFGYTCGSTAFLPTYNILVNPWPSLLTFVYALIITYAIIRHQLLDIRIVIRKSLVYSVLIACITAAYFVMILILERYFQDFLGYKSLVATALVAMLIAIGFNPLRYWLQSIVDRALFHGTPPELAEENDRLLAEIRKSEQQKAISTLAAGLAHEIKNPLTAIKTFTEEMERRGQDPAFRDRFQKIVSGEVIRINHIVQQLLDFAKPTPPRLEPLNPADLLEETLQSLNNELVNRGIEVERHYNGSSDVQADPQQLKQVFLNLLLNSLQAINGQGKLELTTSKERGHV